MKQQRVCKTIKYTSQTYTFLYHEKHNSKNYFKKYKIITNLLNK